MTPDHAVGGTGPSPEAWAQAIKRYSVMPCGAPYCFSKMSEDAHGDHVTYEDHLTALRAARGEALKRAIKLVEQSLDGELVMQCCLAYGGNSFTGPMKRALTEYKQDLLMKLDVEAAALDVGKEG